MRTIIHLALLLVSVVYAAPDTEIQAIYDYVVQKAVGPALPAVTHEEPVVVGKPGKKKLELQDSLPSVAAQRALYGQEFKNIVLATIDSAVTDVKTLDALDVVRTRGSDQEGVTGYIPTQTQGGALYKNIKMAFPHERLDRIHASQHIVRHLVDDGMVWDRLHSILYRIQAVEAQVISFCLPENSANTELFAPLYYGSWLNKFNTSESVLQVGNRLASAYAVAKMAWGFDISYVFRMPEAAQQAHVSWEFGNRTPLQATKHLFVAPARGFWHATKDLPWQFKRGFDMLQNASLPTMERVSMGLGIAVMAGVNGYLLYRSYRALQKEQTHARYLAFMQQRVIAVAEYIRCVQELHELVQAHPALRDNLTHAEYLDLNKQQATYSPECQHVLAMLQTRTFEGQPSLFSNTGRVLAAYRMLYTVARELFPVFLAVSELDAYTGVAQLYADTAQTPARYTFVEFAQAGSGPQVHAQRFWNMCIDPTCVVTNSIAMGGAAAHNVVVTGINRGGKSTIFKSLALNSLWAQAYGIAAADRWVATPFSCISCYLDIVDSVQAGVSTFQAELARAVQLYTKVSAIKPGTYGLLLIDEMFTGTAPEAGIAGTCGFARKLTALPYVCTVFISHFKELALMADKEPNLFSNYHVVAHEHIDGTFMPTYQIQAGFSHQNDAFLMLQNAGIIAQA